MSHSSSDRSRLLAPAGMLIALIGAFIMFMGVGNQQPGIALAAKDALATAESERNPHVRISLKRAQRFSNHRS